MANNSVPRVLNILEQLRPFVVDESAYGRLHADLHDLLEASAWLLKTFSENDGRPLSVSELETLLINIDVHFVDHVLFHLKTLRKDVKATLKNFPKRDEEN
jgi:hypothetical protein